MLPRALLPAAVLAAAVAAPAQAAQVSTTYTAVGESAFVVPAGVHRVDVALTGAHGGAPSNATLYAAGRGAVVTGALAVSPGDRLYVEVGGPGADGDPGQFGIARPGGANGGGSGSAGGGGASDIRTRPANEPGSLTTRLAVAAGGGGAGVVWHGGDAGADGARSATSYAHGRAGTATTGGMGGTPHSGGYGTAGGLGQGGAGAGSLMRGGGGGGGLFGGGGGAGVNVCCDTGSVGGGGGGSSLVPPGGTLQHAARTVPAQVTIGYERPEAALSAARLSFASTQPGAASPSRVVELTNSATSTDLILGAASLDSDEFVFGRSNCHGTLAPGATCRIALRFAPSTAGAHSANLELESNAGRLKIELAGESATPPAPAVPSVVADPPAAPAAPAIVPGTGAPARVTCRAQRCTVTFANPPKLAGKTRVRATLTRGGRVYATADRIARRGPLRLTLSARRAITPGAYTLTLRTGAKRTTLPATAYVLLGR
jgi:hypothetical protein